MAVMQFSMDPATSGMSMSAQDYAIPRRNFFLGRLLGRLLLGLLRWKIRGELPGLSKVVLVVAPHTSNWDWIIGMAAALSLDLDAHWLGKHTRFEGRLRRPLLWLGGIPVNRTRPEGVIEQVVEVCDRREKFLLGVAPEGTRRPVAHWKTGCWRVASATGMPLLPVAIDYAHREIVIYDPFRTGTDMEADMERLSAVFAAEMAKYPDKFIPYRRTGG